MSALYDTDISGRIASYGNFTKCSNVCYKHFPIPLHNMLGTCIKRCDKKSKRYKVTSYDIKSQVMI